MEKRQNVAVKAYYNVPRLLGAGAALIPDILVDQGWVIKREAFQALHFEKCFDRHT